MRETEKEQLNAIPVCRLELILGGKKNLQGALLGQLTKLEYPLPNRQKCCNNTKFTKVNKYWGYIRESPNSQAGPC